MQMLCDAAELNVTVHGWLGQAHSLLQSMDKNIKNNASMVHGNNGKVKEGPKALESIVSAQGVAIP